VFTRGLSLSTWLSEQGMPNPVVEGKWIPKRSICCCCYCLLLLYVALLVNEYFKSYFFRFDSCVFLSIVVDTWRQAVWCRISEFCSFSNRIHSNTCCCHINESAVIVLSVLLFLLMINHFRNGFPSVGCHTCPGFSSSKESNMLYCGDGFVVMMMVMSFNICICILDTGRQSYRSRWGELLEKPPNPVHPSHISVVKDGPKNRTIPWRIAFISVMCWLKISNVFQGDGHNTLSNHTSFLSSSSSSSTLVVDSDFGIQ